MFRRISTVVSTSRARWPIVVVSVVAVPLLAWLDYRTDPVVQMEMLYFVPIVMVGWAAGRRIAMVFAAYVTVMATTVVALQSSRTVAALNGLADLILFMAMAMLIASLRRLLDEQSELAGADPLTHLLNRRAFHDALVRELERAGRDRVPGTMVFFDIDGLKEINDQRGHAAGDAAIARVAEVARACARRTDLLARLGGDEFVAYLPGTDATEAHQFTERLAYGLAGSGDGRAVSVSIGLVTHEPDQTDADALIAQADRAMYRAKRRAADDDGGVVGPSS